MLFKALRFDIDISIQAATKYLIGHSDGMIGTAVSNARCWDQLRENAYLMGQMVDADTAYMTSRGIRTLGVRLRQHHESSLKVAEWLAQHPQVERVNHPALPGSKGHEFWQRDFTGSSGLFSFVLKKRLNNDELASYLDNFTLFSMAYSWGGFESLILPNQPEQVAALRPGGEVDFSGTLIRLHIGLENVDDLIADLAAGFERYRVECWLKMYSLDAFVDTAMRKVCMSCARGSNPDGRIREYNSSISAVPQESPWLLFKILSRRSGITTLPRWRILTSLVSFTS
ncbi:cystathionine beta-lyase metC [Enterobacter asburiae]|uniref:Cystathionine beta-lyase metC n=1 Tax=Enterobacter asburiae TaxID=61645 RepID=A0A376FGY7_ENTAS|nr:cystathionine beta-lyase metC [Enterobacter asburiae]